MAFTQTRTRANACINAVIRQNACINAVIRQTRSHIHTRARTHERPRRDKQIQKQTFLETRGTRGKSNARSSCPSASAARLAHRAPGPHRSSAPSQWDRCRQAARPHRHERWALGTSASCRMPRPAIVFVVVADVEIDAFAGSARPRGRVWPRRRLWSCQGRNAPARDAKRADRKKSEKSVLMNLAPSIPRLLLKTCGVAVFADFFEVF